MKKRYSLCLAKAHHNSFKQFLPFHCLLQKPKILTIKFHRPLRWKDAFFSCHFNGYQTRKLFDMKRRKECFIAGIQGHLSVGISLMATSPLKQESSIPFKLFMEKERSASSPSIICLCVCAHSHLISSQLNELPYILIY
jgi:hypothetical protein